MEFISKLLESQDATLAKILVAVLFMNVFLSGLKRALDYVKDKTETTLDNKAAELLGKILGVGSKVIDFLSANPSALPPKTKAELEGKPQP